MLIFFVFGIISGFLSLIIMALIPSKFANNETIFSISLLASIEEIVKFSLLYFIFSTHSMNLFPKILRLLILPVFLGLGFGFFELSMIFFGQANLPTEAFFPTGIHIISAILLANAVDVLYLSGLKIRSLTFLLLAVFIHICYNVTIVKII